MPNIVLIIGGLVLDICGAAVLATPDVPILRNRHKFGKLRLVQENLEEEGVQSNHDGYKELLEILEDCPLETEAEEKPCSEYQWVEMRQRTGYAPTNIDFAWGTEYVEARYDDEDEHEIADFYQVSDVLSNLRAEERRTESLVRGGGLLLMALGFTIQIVGNVS